LNTANPTAPSLSLRVCEMEEEHLAMLIKVNGAVTTFIAKVRPTGFMGRALHRTHSWASSASLGDALHFGRAIRECPDPRWT